MNLLSNKEKRKTEYFLNHIKNQFPPNVVIELTNYCNFRCTMCWIQLTMKRAKIHINWDHFTKSVDQCVENKVKKISLSYGGESLLYPRLIEAIKYIKSKGIKCEFTTNAFLLNEKISEQLVLSGVDNVTISFHANKDRTFFKVTGSDSYQRVLQNTIILQQIRDKFNPKMTLSAHYNIGDWNKDEYDIQTHPLKSIVDIFSDFYIYDMPTCGENHSIIKRTKRDRPCTLLQKVLIVFSNGDIVLGCCMDSEGEFKIGHIDKDTLKEAFYSKQSIMFRQSHLNNEYKGICEHCLVGYSRPELDGMRIDK